MITDSAHLPPGDLRSASGSSFRPDIEGLRALAVLLVIGAHFAVPGLSAGFIGVDVFFVISGYLITGILVREHEGSGTIALARFYANRFRRLFPALATMLIVSSVLAFTLLPNAQNLAHSEAAAMAALWISNIYFAFSDIDYFGAETSGNAFLHTWSLGVEEQFYLVWPLLIHAVTRWAKNSNRTSSLISLFAVITALSLGISLFASYTQPIVGFYMMPTRAWQFAAGALTWLLVRECAPNKFQAARLSWCGALLLIAALVVISPNSTYPGWLAILPTLGTCALLCSGSRHGKQHLPKALLTLRPMQTIGRLSYAWYLWHWPVLIIGEELLPIKGDANNSLLAVTVSLLAAMLTHHLIENPIRYGRPARLPNKRQLLISVLAMVLLNFHLLQWHTHTQDALVHSTERNPYAKAAFDIPAIYFQDCDDWHKSTEVKPCVFGNKDAKETAVLFGDSIGAQWFPTLTTMLDLERWRIIVLTKSSCPMVDESFFYQRIGREYTECTIWRSKAVEWLQSQKVARIFMGSTASSAFTDKQWTEGTQRLVSQLASTAGAIYLIEANPTLGFNGPDCLTRNPSQEKDSQTCLGTADNSSYAHVASLLKSVANGISSKAHWIETSSFVCPAQKCQAIRDGIVIFRDSQHLTASFAASASEHFLQQIQQYELLSP